MTKGVYHCDKAEKDQLVDITYAVAVVIWNEGTHEVAILSRVTTGSLQFDGELFEHVFNNLEAAML